MDFKSIISSTRNYNFHSHTQFCDGRASMETMARAAVAAGMRHYGFSPHSPVPIPSPCNMDINRVEEYIDEVQRLKKLPELYSCQFYTAMEIDYLGDDWNAGIEYFRNLPLDYTISSVHFIPSQSGEPVDIDGQYKNFAGRMKDHFRNDIEYVVDTFFRQSRRMIETGGFDLVGHFDKIAMNASYYAPGIEDSSFYRGLVDEFIDLIITNECTVELNTKSRVKHGRFFPNHIYLPKLLDAGVSIIVNSDAHYPALINASRDEAFEILDSYGADA